MTRYCTRKHLSRSPYNTSSKRPPLRNSLIYYFRSFLLCRLLLSILPLKSCPYTTSRRTLTTNRHHSPKSPRSTPPKYFCITCIRGHNHLSSSQLNRKQPKTNNPSPAYYNSIRHLLHPLTDIWILWSTLHYLWWHLWLNIFCCYRLPRTSRYYWIYLSYRLPYPPATISFYIKSSFWFWSGCLVLTLCRRRLTLPLHLHLLMRFLFF